MTRVAETMVMMIMVRTIMMDNQQLKIRKSNILLFQAACGVVVIDQKRKYDIHLKCYEL